MNKLTFTFFLLTFTFLKAQAPDTLWTKVYAGHSSEEAYSVQQTDDGGYVIVGYTESFGPNGKNIWLLKTDSNGDTLWTKTYNNSSTWNIGYAVQQTLDGGYVIVGQTGYHGEADLYLIKTDVNGNTIWTKTFGGAYPCQDEGYSVQVASDSGYVVAGINNPLGEISKVYLVKTDENGDTIWTKSYGFFDWSAAYSIQQTSDDGYIVAGYTMWAGQPDILLLKIDSNGDTLWMKHIGTFYNREYGYSVKQTSDFGYIITGTREITSNYDELFLVKTNENGDTIWTRAYGGGEDVEGRSVCQTNDGNYIVVGSGTGPYLSYVWLLKVNTNGDTLWTKMYDGIAPAVDRGYAVQQTSDNGYIVAGYTVSWGNPTKDIWLIKTEPDIGVEEEPNNSLKHSYGSTIISGPLHLPKGKKCKVYDISGRLVNVNRIKPGIYFIEIEGKISQKVVKIR